MKLFGTDGVRGKAGEFLDVITVIKLAQAAGIYFRKHSTTNKILVGKDTRRSGYMIENALSFHDNQVVMLTKYDINNNWGENHALGVEDSTITIVFNADCYNNYFI